VLEIIGNPGDYQIHVGAGEGYFACGMAFRAPGLKVKAYEMNEEAQSLLSGIIKMNYLHDRVEMASECTPEFLRMDLDLHPGALVFMDAEGAEVELLDPERMPGLKICRILVELHEFRHRGVGDLIRQRFQHTHEIDEIKSRDRDLDDLAPPIPVFLRKFRSGTLLHLIGEGRPEQMSWLWMKPYE
jgi:hypothetical protein